MSKPERACPLGSGLPICLSDFELQVLADLAELKTQMRVVVGNGQPGRIQKLEARVEKHEALVQRAAGIGALAGFLTAMLHVLFDWLKARSG
jgi:hypothetical protein